jgi:hypothetical protein
MCGWRTWSSDSSTLLLGFVTHSTQPAVITLAEILRSRASVAGCGANYQARAPKSGSLGRLLAFHWVSALLFSTRILPFGRLVCAFPIREFLSACIRPGAPASHVAAAFAIQRVSPATDSDMAKTRTRREWPIICSKGSSGAWQLARLSQQGMGSSSARRNAHQPRRKPVKITAAIRSAPELPITKARAYQRGLPSATGLDRA